MALINAQNITDLLFQAVHLISIALLAELTKAAEILTDLRGGQAHLAAQLAGRDALDPGSIQIVKLPEIAGHSSDDIVRYFDTFHESLSS